MTLTRRKFLRALGVGAATLPFVGALERSVFGADPDHATRFIGIFHPHGASSPLFLGTGTDGCDIAFPDSVLSPFDDASTYGRSFKDVILPLAGVDVLAASGHSAPQALLTGSESKNSSLDYFLAVEQGLGDVTPVSHLVLGVGAGGTSQESSLTYGPGGVPLPKVIDPRQTFQLLFANFVSGDDPEAQARLAYNRARGKSVLDHVRADLSRLNGRLAAPERLKLEQHTTSLREIEKRLDATQPGGVACMRPGEPPEIPRLQSYNGGEPYFDQITDLQIDLLAQAMACDITRFATLWMGDLSRGGAEPAGLAGLPDNNHDDLAHLYDGPRGAHYGNAKEGTPGTWSDLGRLNRYHYGKCARLLERLDAYGVLDETLVWMSSDMGNPASHSSRNVPTLLAGGAGGTFRMGRRVVLNSDCPPDRYFCDDPTFVPNNHLLVSIAQAFGVDVDRFGTDDDPSVTTGEISALW